MQYNLFMYCNGDPVDVVDYEGNEGITLSIVFIAAVVAVAIVGGYVASQNYRLSHSVNVSDVFYRAVESVQEKVKAGIDDYTLRNQYVYFLEDKDGVAYVGRTKHLSKRIIAHQHSLNRDHLLYNEERTISNLTLAEARAIEQIEMIAHHTLRSSKEGCNAINGISPTNPKLFEYFAAAQLSGVSRYLDNQLVDFLYNWLENNI